MITQPPKLNQFQKRRKKIDSFALRHGTKPKFKQMIFFLGEIIFGSFIFNPLHEIKLWLRAIIVMMLIINSLCRGFQKYCSRNSMV